MSLTPSEIELVKDCLRTYPAGVPDQSWGYGRLVNVSVMDLEMLDPATRRRYG